MAITVVFNGSTYSIPEAQEEGWPTLTDFLVDVGTNAQTTGSQSATTRVATTSPVTVAAADYLVVTKLTVPGAVTVNLPAGTNGKIYAIVDGTYDAATNNVTINRNGTDTINNSTSLVINSNGGGYLLQYVATTLNWQVVGDFTVGELTRTSTDQGANRVKNKDLEAATTKIVDASDTTKKLAFDPSGNTTAVTQTVSSQATANRTWLLPDASDTAVGKATTDTLTNKTLTAPVMTGPKISDFNEYTESAAPSTPASGKGRTYVSTDGKFKFLNDDGVTKTLGDSGTGEVNAVANPTDAASGWTAGTSHSVATLTSGSPLDPITPGGIRATATSTASESSTSGVIYTVSTVAAGIKNRKLKVQFYYTVSASQTWALSVYSGSTRYALSTDSSAVTTLPTTGVTGGIFTTYFDADTSTSYTINFTRTAGSGSTNLDLTQVILGPGITAQGAIVGEWLSYTPNASVNQGLGTITSQALLYRRVGGEIEVTGSFSTGTVSGSEARLAIPDGLTVYHTSAALQFVGRIAVDSAATSAYHVLAANGNGYVGFGRTDGTDKQLDLKAGTLFNSTERKSVWFKVPITQYQGNGTVNIAQNDVEYASNSGMGDANDTSSFVYGSSGSLLPGTTYTAARTKRVRFLTPIQPNDVIAFQVDLDSTGKWANLCGGVVVGGDDVADYGSSIGMGGFQRVASTTTDIDVIFGQFRSGASNWNSNTDDGKWRLVKSKSGAAVGFGVVADGAAGLMPANNSNLDNASASRLGLKAYAHGSTYNGGNAPTVTLTGGGGTLSSVEEARFYPRQLNDGTWVLSGSVALTLSSTSRTNPQFAINSVTATTADHFCAGNATSVAAPVFRTLFNSTSISMTYASATTTTHSFCFNDIPLTGKPNWVY